MGNYSDRVVAGHRGKTASQIRSEKNQRSKSRNLERKKKNIERDKELYSHWRSLKPEDQWKILQKNQLKGASRQKAKLRKKLGLPE